MKPIDPEAVEQARKVLEKVRATWLERPGVTGIDVGLRERGGQLVDEVAIRVYVVRKVLSVRLPPPERFPPLESGVPVDVIEFQPRRNPSR